MKAFLSIVMVAFVLSFTPIPVVPAVGQQVVTATSPNAEALSEMIRKHIPKDIPILADVSITPPDSSVPAELARLSGAWVGEWRGARTGAYMMDHVYVFEKVSNTSVTVASMGVGRFVGDSNTNYGQTWANRYELQPETTTPLTVTLPNGNRVTFQIQDGQLKTRSVHRSGNSQVGTFKKIQ